MAEKSDRTKRCPMHESVDSKCPVHNFISKEMKCFYGRLAAKFGHNYYGEMPEDLDDGEAMIEQLQDFKESERALAIIKMPKCPLNIEKAEKYINKAVSKTYEAMRQIEEPKLDIQQLREYVSNNLNFTLNDDVAINFKLGEEDEGDDSYFIFYMGGFYGNNHQRHTSVTPFLVITRWDYFVEMEDEFEVLYERTQEQFKDKEKGENRHIIVLSAKEENQS